MSSSVIYLITSLVDVTTVVLVYEHVTHHVDSISVRLEVSEIPPPRRVQVIIRCTRERYNTLRVKARVVCVKRPRLERLQVSLRETGVR